jgi:hypothetical protein
MGDGWMKRYSIFDTRKWRWRLGSTLVAFGVLRDLPKYPNPAKNVGRAGVFGEGE